MNYQSLCSGNKKNIINLSSAEEAQRVADFSRIIATYFFFDFPIGFGLKLSPDSFEIAFHIYQKNKTKTWTLNFDFFLEKKKIKRNKTDKCCK